MFDVLVTAGDLECAQAVACVEAVKPENEFERQRLQYVLDYLFKSSAKLKVYDSLTAKPVPEGTNRVDPEPKKRDPEIVGMIQNILLRDGLGDGALELALEIADAVENYDAEFRVDAGLEE
jgi:hypothetical protein